MQRQFLFQRFETFTFGQTIRSMMPKNWRLQRDNNTQKAAAVVVVISAVRIFKIRNRIE